jgi:ADP-L-glycero-D-manno-heptose 6-epimerase
MIEVNTGGFRDLLHNCHHNAIPLVYASSAATYGTPDAADQRRPFRTDDAGAPNNVYGFSKWLMENEHRRFAADTTGLPAEGWENARIPNTTIAGGAPHAVGLRYFNVFGPGERAKKHMASLAHQLASKMLNGENPKIFTPGDQTRDQVPVEDVVDGTLAAAAPDITPGIYNLGSGVPTTFNELVDAVREGLGFTPDQRPTEYFEMPEHIRRFYQSFTLADMTETTEALNWSPTRQPSHALARYAAAIKSEHEQRAPIAETA